MIIPEDRIFIIAEAGSNWRCGSAKADLEMARTMIGVAAGAGADAVKFQVYTAESVYVPNAGDSDYLSGAGIKKPITEIFRELEMPRGMIPELAAHCAVNGVQFMASAFSVPDMEAIDPHVKVHKIASYEISHTRLIDFAAHSGKPLILSTGAADLEDIDWAVGRFRESGGTELVLLQCTAKYPAPLTTVNVRAMQALAERFGTPVGLSDHSRDPVAAPAAAAALGARVIEKHFTMDNRLPGPDHAFAVTASELKLMVKTVRNVEQSLGDVRKDILVAEGELRGFARRAVQATADIKKGDTLAEGVNIGILRPGKQKQGVHPKYLPEIEGRKAARDISLGDGIRHGDFV